MAGIIITVWLNFVNVYIEFLTHKKLLIQKYNNLSISLADMCKISQAVTSGTSNESVRVQYIYAPEWRVLSRSAIIKADF